MISYSNGRNSEEGTNLFRSTSSFKKRENGSDPKRKTKKANHHHE
jgi:hypothetical protein